MKIVAVQRFCELLFWWLSGLSSGFLSFSNSDLEPEEFRITACGLSGDSDLWFDVPSHCIKDRNWIYISDPVLRRVGFVRSMYSVVIVPELVLAEPLL